MDSQSRVLDSKPLGGSEVNSAFHLFSSIPYENHCKCYKKLTSRSWPVLFTLNNFFLLYTLFSSAVKKVVSITVFLSKLDHRSLFIYIYYQTILVWGLVSIWITNTKYCPSLFKYYCLLKSNEVHGNCAWISKWVNLHFNWINLMSVLNFPKQRVADYKGVFRILSNIEDGVFYKKS